MQLTDVVPYLLEDVLQAQGARFSATAPWGVHVVRDGLLVTDRDGGGASFNVQPCGVGRWIIKYTGISTDEFNLLRDHLNLAKGRTNYFDLISVREAVIWHGVQYEKWETVPHEKNWLRNVTVTLIKLK